MPDKSTAPEQPALVLKAAEMPQDQASTHRPGPANRIAAGANVATSADQAEETLGAIYGGFNAKSMAPRMAFSLTENADAATPLLRIQAGGMTARRRRNGLQSKWQGHVFILHQIAGELHVRSGNRSCLLRPADTVLIDAESSCEYLTAEPCELIMTGIPLASIAGARDIPHAYCRRIPGSSDAGRAFRRSMSLASRSGDSEEEGGASADSLQQTVARTIAYKAVAQSSREAELLDCARHFVSTELDNVELSPAMLASAIGVSRRQLYRLFDERGETPSAWVWRTRLEKARERMSSDLWAGRSLTDIAFATGFNDAAHFSRAFRRLFGCSPRQICRQEGRMR